MKHIREEYAEGLRDELLQRFADRAQSAAITVDGRTSHWHCKAHLDEVSCTIHCFDILEEPEYLMSFERGTTETAMGRTCSKHHVLEAVEEWLRNKDLAKLYRRFAFVDHGKRSLTSLRESVVAHFPELAEPVSEVEHRDGDIYYLWFRNGDRSCCISYRGRNEFPDAAFHWDACELFRFQADNPRRLAEVLKRWIADRAMPSVMRKEFPWLEIGELADYYERGNPIEGEFRESWDEMQRFYADMKFSYAREVRYFIAQMRARGHDKTLRAGQSMWSFIVSRSRRHRLRAGQPNIAFSFGDSGTHILINVGGRTEFIFPKIEFTPEIEVLLRELEDMDID